MPLDLRPHANAQLEDFEDLKQGVGMRNRVETLLRRLLQSATNPFGNAARRDAGSAAGQVPLLGAGGVLVRARWPARLAASAITGVLGAARIGNHDAAKAAQGVFQTGQIPSLDAGKFTRGRFGAGQIPAQAATTNWFSSFESVNTRTASGARNPDSRTTAVFNTTTLDNRYWTRITGCNAAIDSANKLTITITQQLGGSR